MNRTSALWTLVLFFGASLMFAYIQDAAGDEGVVVALVAQVVAGILLVVVIVLVIKHRD